MFMRLTLICAVFVCSGLMFAAPASAQYSYNPNNADEQGPGIKYFGSAKDDRGALPPGVSIIIQHEIILVTDEQGRYRGNVDYIYTWDHTTVTCSKPGYSFVRVNKRPGPAGLKKKTVQADCILHKNE